MSEVNKGGDNSLVTYKITLNFKLNQNYQANPKISNTHHQVITLFEFSF